MVPDRTFRWYPERMEVVIEDESIVLFDGISIWNVYISDLSGDGMPEICAAVTFGFGIVDTHIVVYDYAARQGDTLRERGQYDYVLQMENAYLICDKYMYPEGELIASGTLMFVNNDGGEDWPIPEKNGLNFFLLNSMIKSEGT